MTDEVAADETDSEPDLNKATREKMAELRGSGYTKLRHILCQLPKDSDSRESTVGRLVGERQHKALLLYMLLVANWNWLPTQEKPLEASVWIRALNFDGGPSWSTSTLSRTWAVLENAGLITKRERFGRGVQVTPRREDGRDEYVAPTGAADRWNTYFVLPDAFWLEGLFARLSLPGLAMLLIIAGGTSQKDEIMLIHTEAKKWYGISPKTMQNGIRDLEKHQLVDTRFEKVPAALSRTGYTTHTWYRLKGEYSREARAALQAKARADRARRLGGNATPGTVTNASEDDGITVNSEATTTVTADTAFGVTSVPTPAAVQSETATAAS